MCSPQFLNQAADDLARQSAEHAQAQAQINPGVQHMMMTREIVDRPNQPMQYIGQPRYQMAQPITAEEFNGGVMHDSINSTPPMIAREFRDIPYMPSPRGLTSTASRPLQLFNR
jgi:hypothetical protein